jgi:hypothetical protein
LIRSPEAVKTIRHAFVAISITLLITASPIHAALYQTNSPTFGPNSVTVDTSTQLGWLDLNESAGLTYNQVSSEMQAGEAFYGFRYATEQEVIGLYTAAGLTPSANGDTSHYYPASSPSIQLLFSLIGTTGIINGHPGIIAMSGTSDSSGLYRSPSIYSFQINGNTEYWVSGDSVNYGSTYSFPELSSWLVEPVPEPSSAQLLMTAVVSWCGFKFWKPGKKR